jgi:hypothetical protein
VNTVMHLWVKKVGEVLNQLSDYQLKEDFVLLCYILG